MQEVSKLSLMEFLKYSVVAIFLSSSIAVLAQKSKGPMEHAGRDGQGVAAMPLPWQGR